jgi:hypothetical protein
LQVRIPGRGPPGSLAEAQQRRQQGKHRTEQHPASKDTGQATIQLGTCTGHKQQTGKHMRARNQG